MEFGKKSGQMVVVVVVDYWDERRQDPKISRRK